MVTTAPAVEPLPIASVDAPPPISENDPELAMLDRKSTRLNSSHLGTSYAVFCLKKKNLPFDPENRYSIPYLWGTVGIGYDSNVIPAAPESWAVLWDPRDKRRSSMLTDQRELFGT